MITSREDQYRWRVLPELQHLFTKQLSDHTLGAFKDLCEGLGKTFEAVPQTEGRSITPSIGSAISVPTRVSQVTRQVVLVLTNEKLSTSSAQTSLSSRIDELQELNAELVKEISSLHDQVASELAVKKRLEGELGLLNETNRQLRQEIEKKAQERDYFWVASVKYAEGIRRMVPIIDGLKNTATFTADGCF